MYFFSFTLHFRPSFLLSIGMTVFFVQLVCTLCCVHALKPLITKWVDLLTHGAPLAGFARLSSATNRAITYTNYIYMKIMTRLS